MELLRLGTDRAEAALRTTAVYLFIYYLRDGRMSERFWMKFLRGQDAMEEFSVKPVSGLRRSCVDRSDFLSLKTSLREQCVPFSSLPQGETRVCYLAHTFTSMSSDGAQTHTSTQTSGQRSAWTPTRD